MEKQDIALVQDYRNYLRVRNRTEFTLLQLVDHIYCKPFGSSKRTKDEILKLLTTEFVNTTKPMAFVIPKKGNLDSFRAKETRLALLEDYIRAKISKKKVLNARRVDKYFEVQLPVFYNKEYHKHDLLQRPSVLVGKIARSIQSSINLNGLTQTSRIKINEAIPNIQFTEQFIQLIHLLPFIDPASIMADKAKGQLFFINLYNILRLHAIVEYSKLSTIRESDIQSESSQIYNGLYYNIAGDNFSLNDIKYNILQVKTKNEVKKPYHSLSDFYATSRGAQRPGPLPQQTTGRD